MKVTWFASLAAALALPLVSSAAPLYSNDFNSDTTASWTVNDPGATDKIVDFNYDYSLIGVPAAPNGTGTRGLKMAVNNTAGVNSGFSVSPTGFSASGNYRVEFDLWANRVGPALNGTTQLASAGIGTSGTTAFHPGAATKESVTFSATLDADSASDYRAYSSNLAGQTSYPAGNAVYQAPGGAINDTNAYYTAAFPSVPVPAAQVALFPTQATSTSRAGSISYAWRRVKIEVLDGFATWSIDNLPIAKVDLSTVTLGGGNILFGMSDTNATMSTDANRALLNVALIDNVTVTQIIPEPASLGLVAMGLGLAAAARRRV